MVTHAKCSWGGGGEGGTVGLGTLKFMSCGPEPNIPILIKLSHGSILASDFLLLRLLDHYPKNSLDIDLVGIVNFVTTVIKGDNFSPFFHLYLR